MWILLCSEMLKNTSRMRNKKHKYPGKSLPSLPVVVCVLSGNCKATELRVSLYSKYSNVCPLHIRSQIQT